MAFDSNNNIPQTSGQTQPTQAPLDSGNQPKKAPISPWEEDLPEETPKPQQIGTLLNSTGDKAVPLKKEGGFVVPENIENKSALNVVDGADFKSSTPPSSGSILPASTPIPTLIEDRQPIKNTISSPTENQPLAEKEVIENPVEATNGARELKLSPSQPKIIQPVSPQPFAEKKVVENPVEVTNGVRELKLSPSQPEIIQAIPSQPVQLEATVPAPDPIAEENSESFDDLDIFGDVDSAPKNIAQDIRPASAAPAATAKVPTFAPTVSQAPVAVSIPAQQPMANQTPPDLQGIITPAPTALPPVPTNRVAPPPVVPPQALNKTVPVNPALPKKKLFTADFLGRFNRKKPTTPLAPNQSRAANVMTAPNPSPISPSGKRRIMIPLEIIGGIVGVFIIGILLTESGVASFGFEKVYNALGLEVLWGGLPKNAEKSLGLSLFSMKNVSGFKVSGDIKLAISESVQSEVTNPLISMGVTKNKSFAVKPEKAILAVSDITTDTYDPATIYVDDTTSSDTSTDTSTSSDTSSLTTDGSSQTSTTATDQTSDSSTVDQTSDSSYQSYQSSIKEVDATVSGSFSKDGTDLNLTVDKAGTALIELKNSADKLWVQSDKIKFNDKAEDGKWLQYTMTALQGKNLFEGFFASDFSAISIAGQKKGNEKIDNIRCYHYQIDSIELAEALSEIGISSDMVQSISGDVWIGIKDKLIRKIDLKIMPSTSSSVTALEVTAKFSSFNAPGRFTAPDSLNTITELAPFSALTTDSTSTTQDTSSSTSDSSASSTATADSTTDSTVTAPVDLSAQNDSQRKSDLLSIKNSLEAYKADHGSYPISSVVAKLNLESNILAQKLISSYIAVLPKDPKDAEGWFYGYKSTNGSSYYLSAKLETLSDISIKLVDNIPLYFVYNQ